MSGTLSAARLRALLSYDQETGLFTWIVSRGTAKRGSLAGAIDNHGYMRIKIDRKNYRAHRLAWLWMTGRWPYPECDHEDLNRANNRWVNLRQVSRGQNITNRKVQANNKCGLKGVYWHKQSGTWRAQVRFGGKGRVLGNFHSPDAAHAAYMDAAGKLFGRFGRTA